MKTTHEVSNYLDQYVVGQVQAKRAIAVAYRRRVLKSSNKGGAWEDVRPDNILMVGPSGVGKTELARRLAALTDAPFIKVEITEFTQMGYYGRDVRSILSDLVAEAVRVAPEIYKRENKDQAPEKVIHWLKKLFVEEKEAFALELKVPAMELTFDRMLGAYHGGKLKKLNLSAKYYVQIINSQEEEATVGSTFEFDNDFDVSNFMRAFVGNKGRVEDLRVFINTCLQIAGKHFKESEKEVTRIQTVFGDELAPKLIAAIKSGDRVRQKIATLLRKLKDRDVVKKALEYAEFFVYSLPTILEPLKTKTTGEMPDDFIVKLIEERGIVFIDEVDKIFIESKSGGNPGTVGVIRDLMPYLDGVTAEVSAQYDGGRERGSGGKKYRINTANILWIASGAFQMAKVSDIPAEILGRLPVHIKLDSLTRDHLVGVLKKPHGSTVAQTELLMSAEGIDFKIDDSAIEAIADLAFACNQKGEDIGARRLTSVCTSLFEQMLYDASNMTPGTKIVIDAAFVAARERDIIERVHPRK